MQERQQLLHEEERRAHIDREQAIEVRDGDLLDRRGLGDAGIGDQHVQPIANQGTHLCGELVRAVGGREVRGDSIRAATGRTDLRDDGFRLRFALAVVDENPSTIAREGEG